MATPRTIEQLLASFPDNTAGLITPAEVRDLVVSGPIRAPGSYPYLVDSSATAGRIVWDELDTLTVNGEDWDGVSRASAWDELNQVGAVITLIDTTTPNFALLRVVAPGGPGPVYAITVEILHDTGGITLGDLVAVEVAPALPPTGPQLSRDLVNAGADDWFPGLAVAVDPAAGGGLLAIASDTTLPAIGLALLVATPTEVASVQCAGVVVLEDWSAATGSADLVPATDYFLSPDDAGQLLTTPPATAGQCVQVVGRALDARAMRLVLSLPILL